MAVMLCGGDSDRGPLADPWWEFGGSTWWVHKPIMGVCGQSPQRGPGTQPLVMRVGAESFFAIYTTWGVGHFVL